MPVDESLGSVYWFMLKGAISSNERSEFHADSGLNIAETPQWSGKYRSSFAPHTPIRWYYPCHRLQSSKALAEREK
jgi:hypothetical protein